MESFANDAPLVVIVGPTASGKSAVALELAERYGGEIIAADSRTVYRGMDIGTAKPTLDDRKRVAHHLIDICDVNDVFTVADFQRLAKKAIDDIVVRGAIPFLVGGTGLYVDAVLFNFGFRGGADRTRREELERLSVEELQQLLLSRAIALPPNERNPRHLIRALESDGLLGTSRGLRPNTLVLGLDSAKEELLDRISARVDAMLAHGLEAEVNRLVKRYGWDAPPMQTIGYQEFRPYLAQATSIKEVRQAIILHTGQYAKRQKTWFRRNPAINWISNSEQCVELLTTFLNK